MHKHFYMGCILLIINFKVFYVKFRYSADSVVQYYRSRVFFFHIDVMIDSRRIPEK